jgi:hypothetical protein
MEWLNDVAVWAWARHHNILSWYIRPLFLLPFCYFAYKRSWTGIVGTLIALATSMFWFPAPDQPDPEVIAMLEAERVYLTGAWTWWKIMLTLVVPGAFIALGLAFWKQSWWYGLVVINAMALSKIVWSFAVAPADGALALLLPALVGLAICNAVVMLGVSMLRRRPLLKPTS